MTSPIPALPRYRQARHLQNALYNGTACVEGKGATPPAISTPPAETDDCTSQLIYVWDDVLVDP